MTLILFLRHKACKSRVCCEFFSACEAREMERPAQRKHRIAITLVVRMDIVRYACVARVMRMQHACGTRDFPIVAAETRVISSRAKPKIARTSHVLLPIPGVFKKLKATR